MTGLTSNAATATARTVITPVSVRNCAIILDRPLPVTLRTPMPADGLRRGQVHKIHRPEDL